MSDVKTGKTEWKVRAASLATFAGSLIAVSLIETRGLEFVNSLPEGVKIVALPLLVTAGAWFSGRIARSRPDFIAPSTIDAVIKHIDERHGGVFPRS